MLDLRSISNNDTPLLLVNNRSAFMFIIAVMSFNEIKIDPSDYSWISWIKVYTSTRLEWLEQIEIIWEIKSRIEVYIWNMIILICDHKEIKRHMIFFITDFI